MTDIYTQGGTVCGLNHNTNQDHFIVMDAGQAHVLLVADGCGSSPKSEYGAMLFTHRMASYLGTLPEPTLTPDIVDTCWTEFQRFATIHLHQMASGVPGNYCQQFVNQFLLATLHVCVVTPEDTFAFGSGDGVVWFNEDRMILEPPRGDAPAYPAYTLVDDVSYTEEDVSFDLHFQKPTEELEFAGVASDGVAELIERKDEEIRGGDTVGDLSQFQDEQYTRSPHMVSKRLRSIGQVNEKLHDDTTVAYAVGEE